jgi:hypothetical protein
MVLYLTPDAYRVGGFGMDVSSFSDPELANLLAGASAQVNTYCAAPNLPQAHDFRGGSITGEQHSWMLGTVQRRFRPWHQPVKAITQFHIYVSNNNYVDLAPQYLFVNNSEGWVEVVALALGIGVYPVIANLSMNQPVGQMDYSYGYSFPVTGETLFETDGQTFRATNQWWDSTVAPVIYIDGVDSSGSFTINYDEGTATSAAELDAGVTVTADYTHRLPYAIARATGVIATAMIGQARIAARGMIGLSRIHVAEIDITRQSPTASSQALLVPDEAASLLAPFVFR